MRVCVIDRGSKFPVPPEQMPAMMDQFVEWRERWRPKMESFDWFVDGGGCGVVNVDDEAELHQMMLEYPFAFVDDVEMKPVVDGDRALAQAREAMRALAGQTA